jgi:hypothetical protein
MLKLISFVKKNLRDVSSELELDSNRKKSANMVLTSVLLNELLEQTQKKLKLESVNVIFTSSEGELQQTFDFFKNLALGRARPILFQNSLHNSTLGALSLELPNIASGITMSNGDICFESAIDMALAGTSPLPVIILGVDVYNTEIQKIRAESYGAGIELTSGGCAAVFIPSTHPLFASLPGPIIQDIKFASSTEPAKLTEYYPSNGMEAIYTQLQTAQKEFTLLRPHQHQVTVYAYEP